MPGALSLLARKHVVPVEGTALHRRRVRLLHLFRHGRRPLIQNDEQLDEMTDEPYDSEDLLQMLLGRK